MDGGRNQISVTVIQNCSGSKGRIFMSPNAKVAPGMCKTPVRPRRLSKVCEDEIYSPGIMQHHSTSTVSFVNLPLHTTPPSRLNNFVVTNPFDKDIRKKLHVPLVSPTLFAGVVSPSKGSNEFSWTVDDVAILKPAEIDEFQNQYEECVDPEVEREAQDSIDRFFESNPIVPSPWGQLELHSAVFLPMDKRTSSPPVPYPVLNMSLEDASSRCSTPKLIRRDAATQTELSFLPEVAASVESVLECCAASTQEQFEMKNFVSSQTSPFYCTWGSPVPVTACENLLSSTIHTPMRVAACRTFGTPLPSSSLLSPIDMSPIVHSLYYKAVPVSPSISANGALSNTWSQTDLSLPQLLPSNMETVLQSYLTASQEQIDSDDMNLNSSLSRRRKLLFHENDDLDMSIASVDNGYNTS